MRPPPCSGPALSWWRPRGCRNYSPFGSGFGSCTQGKVGEGVEHGALQTSVPPSNANTRDLPSERPTRGKSLRQHPRPPIATRAWLLPAIVTSPQDRRGTFGRLSRISRRRTSPRQCTTPPSLCDRPTEERLVRSGLRSTAVGGLRSTAIGCTAAVRRACIQSHAAIALQHNE